MFFLKFPDINFWGQFEESFPPDTFGAFLRGSIFDKTVLC